MNTECYFLLRLAMGISFLGHGLVRIPKLKTFSSWMVGAFSKSMMPRKLVLPFSYILPFVEFTIGLLCITGLFTYPVSATGCVVMLMLMLGPALLKIGKRLFHSSYM